ncbi:MAG: exo-beta-N-acetylmuramidase NamZ domain-containing protein [Gemmatimonadota bacterium]
MAALGGWLAILACAAPTPRSGPPVTGAGSGAGAGPGAHAAPPGHAGAVRPGLDVLLADSLHLVAGRRVGLITNHTALDARGRHAIDRLSAAGVELAALFAPEHGLRGRLDPGQPVTGGRDRRTGVPIHSLYGETRQPTPEMLAGLDVLLLDLQDVGARYYTYVWTLALAMGAAAEAGVPFVVLDRPNPIGGVLVKGNVLEPEHASFVGLHPIPMRHGMTMGELARLFNDRFSIGADLRVAPVSGWSREAWWDATGLPWVPPSPNMPSLESAVHYPGTCLFEGTNLSVGRGTEIPFQQVGAPWLDGHALAERLNDRRLPGVRFTPVRFTPSEPGDGKYSGESVYGVRFVATDRERYDPTLTAVAALLEARRLAGARWEWRTAHFDRLAGTTRLRELVEAGRPLPEIVRPWHEALKAFAFARRPYMLYGSRASGGGVAQAGVPSAGPQARCHRHPKNC